MTWRITVCFSMIVTMVLLEGGHGQETMGTTGVTPAPESSPSNIPAAFLGPYYVWKDKTPSDSSVVDADNLVRAINNSAAWIRAVLRHEQVPEDLEKHIVGEVNAIDGYDVTRVEFETEQFTFLVTQDSRRIVILASPMSRVDSETQSTGEELETYLLQSLNTLFKHAKAIEFLTQFEQTPFGLQMVRDQNLYDDDGSPLSYGDRKRISNLPEPEHSEAFHRLRRLHEARLLAIDPTVPREAIGGTIHYWWGLAHPATDGRFVVFSAPKSNAGALVVANCKDWFRRDQLPRRARRNPRKPYRPGSLWPPKDAPNRTDE